MTGWLDTSFCEDRHLGLNHIASARAVAGQTTLFDCIGVPDEHSNIKKSGA